MSENAFRRVVAALLLMGSVALVEQSSAQTITLGEPVAEYLEGMSFLQSVREMPDGRLLLADPIGQQLFFLDMESGATQFIGREGSGPMEYRQPDSVWPFPGGTSIMVDLGNARLVELAADGSFGETYSLIMGDPGPGTSMLLLLPQGVDGAGRIYATQRPAFDPSGERSDSSFVIRVDVRTETVDTLAQIKTQDVVMSRAGGNVQMRQIPLSSADGWGVAPDGRVAIARSGDYHLEWHHPDGTVVAGNPIPFEPVRIRNPEKLAYLNASSGAGISVSIQAGGDGQRSMAMSRGGGGGGDGPDVDEFDWPETMPPMSNGRINVDSEGRAWVARNRAAGETGLYDVFGADGNLITTVEMQGGRRIVGFGQGTAYVIYNDEFDLIYLEKYRVPAL